MNRIQFNTQPDATLFPLDLVPVEEKLLKDFKWLQQFRPLSRNEIFTWQNREPETVNTGTPSGVTNNKGNDATRGQKPPQKPKPSSPVSR